MTPLRRLATVAALGALAASLGGCLKGEAGDEARTQLERGASSDEIREGLAVPVDGVRYTVFITRQLNPTDPEDEEYLRGVAEPEPGRVYYGVFLEACAPEEEEEGLHTAEEFAIEDTIGTKYHPKEVPDHNVFAYRPTKLAPGVCLPNKISATSYGPTGGSMLLFDVPVSAAENRPLELEVTSHRNRFHPKKQTAKFELDI